MWVYEVWLIDCYDRTKNRCVAVPERYETAERAAAGQSMEGPHLGAVLCNGIIISLYCDGFQAGPDKWRHVLRSMAGLEVEHQPNCTRFDPDGHL